MPARTRIVQVDSVVAQQFGRIAERAHSGRDSIIISICRLCAMFLYVAASPSLTPG